MRLFSRRQKLLTEEQIEELFEKHGSELHKFIAKGYLRPKGFDGMEHAFSGTDGRAYYTWIDVGEMTPVRQKHIERCLKFAEAGIGEKTLDQLCTAGETANMDALKAGKANEKSKAHSRVAYIFGELRNRAKDVIPEEVYYDMAAIFAVREDEDPRTFDVAIHGQKIVMLKEAGASGHDFFAALPGFKKLLGSLLTSEAAFIELLSDWTAQRNRLKAITQAFEHPSPSK